MWTWLAIFSATFVLEDVAAVGAGALAGSGQVGWSTAFWSCFLGIWAGDMGLYLAARMLGRPWFERSWLRRHAGKVQQSEQLFARYGVRLLVISRLLPGTRLPTFLAAGFLRMPWLQFFLVMGVASFFWTAGLLWAVFHFGSALATALGFLRTGGWILVVLAASAALWFVRRATVSVACDFDGPGGPANLQSRRLTATGWRSGIRVGL